MFILKLKTPDYKKLTIVKQYNNKTTTYVGDIHNGIPS